MESVEWDFVCEVAERLAMRADEYDRDMLTPEEQVVLLPWWASGIIGNGGFRYFYEGATETLEVAAAFDALGLGDAADACRTAHSRVPAEVLAGGYGACQAWMDTISDVELDALFESLNRVIWDAEDRMIAALATYIRAHALSPPS
jgi:hypothetical protein